MCVVMGMCMYECVCLAFLYLMYIYIVCLRASRRNYVCMYVRTYDCVCVCVCVRARAHLCLCILSPVSK